MSKNSCSKEESSPTFPHDPGDDSAMEIDIPSLPSSNLPTLSFASAPADLHFGFLSQPSVPSSSPSPYVPDLDPTPPTPCDAELAVDIRNYFYPSLITSSSKNASYNPSPPCIEGGFPSQRSLSCSSLSSYSSSSTSMSVHSGPDVFPFPPEYQHEEPNISDPDLPSFLESSLQELGTDQTAQVIFDNQILKQKLMQLMIEEARYELKKSLKKSMLVNGKRNKDYLLSLSPQKLCVEWMENAPQSFHLISGLLGSTKESLFENQGHMNTLATTYSDIARKLNRKASGWSLYLTTLARHGGLREDSIKLICCMSHPRTSQKYDRHVLAKDWDSGIRNALALEESHFKKAADGENETNIKQVQLVWDNLNLRTKHKFERLNDEYSTSNLDWMASLWLKERIDASHMEHSIGEAFKKPEDLSIEDFVPKMEEINYIFSRLVRRCSSRLISRHPLVFASLNSSIKVRSSKNQC